MFDLIIIIIEIEEKIIGNGYMSQTFGEIEEIVAISDPLKSSHLEH